VHDLRRSAVRELIAAGVDEKTAMAITGHVTRSVFDRYHIVSGADMADAVAKVASRRRAVAVARSCGAVAKNA
jgi:integrase